MRANRQNTNTKPTSRSKRSQNQPITRQQYQSTTHQQYQSTTHQQHSPSQIVRQTLSQVLKHAHRYDVVLQCRQQLTWHLQSKKEHLALGHFSQEQAAERANHAGTRVNVLMEFGNKNTLLQTLNSFVQKNDMLFVFCCNETAKKQQKNHAFNRVVIPSRQTNTKDPFGNIFQGQHPSHNSKRFRLQHSNQTTAKYSQKQVFGHKPRDKMNQQKDSVKQQLQGNRQKLSKITKLPIQARRESSSKRAMLTVQESTRQTSSKEAMFTVEEIQQSEVSEAKHSKKCQDDQSFILKAKESFFQQQSQPGLMSFNQHTQNPNLVQEYFNQNKHQETNKPETRQQGTIRAENRQLGTNRAQSQLTAKQNLIQQNNTADKKNNIQNGNQRTSKIHFKAESDFMDKFIAQVQLPVQDDKQGKAQPKKQDTIAAGRSQQNRFSFAMRQGLMQTHNQPQQGWLSLKLAGDEEMERAKKAQINIHAQHNGLTNISNLSSIIGSNTRQLTIAHEDCRSFKNDIEHINKCFFKPELETINRCLANTEHDKINQLQSKLRSEKGHNCLTGGEAGESSKIQLMSLGLQNEQRGVQCVQVSQKTARQGQASEYVVRYNLNMLEKRCYQTSVIRISPLRFRKKEELVKHLINNKIVERQSDSVECN